jgi:hypothetical protein
MSAGLVPGVGLDISSDGTRAVVTGTSFGTGRVQRIDLVNWTLDGPDIPVGGDPRNVVITPDGTTALVADHNGRVLFIDLATANVTQTVTDLSALNGINAIDIEPNGLTAWFTDRVTSWIFSLDVATRVATIESTVSHADINGKFIGKPFFRNAGTPNVVDTDAELTTLGFGAEVIVWGSLTLNGPFTSGRTFRFNDTPQLTVSMGPAVTLTGVLRGDGFNLVGGGLLITTGSYTLGPVDVGGTTTTLHVEGTHAGDISVHSGAFVTGTGTVGKLTVGSGGTVAPGASSGPGILTAGDTTFQGGTLFAFINGTMPGLGYSQLNTTSTTFVSGASLVTSVAYPTGPGDTFTIVTNRAAGTFNLLPEGSTINLAGTAAFVRYTGGDGNDVTLSVHTAPTASALQNAATDEDVPYSGSITIGDDLTLPDNLLVTAASSNTALIPNVTVSATGAVRNLQASPNAGLSGNTTITVQVSDGNWFTERSFVLTVTPVNDLPFIAAIADRTIDHDTTTGPIPFTVTDLDGFDGHTVTASSSNLLLVPNANMTIGGADGSRTITIVPAAGQHGTATITVTVDDGGATYSRTFTLTVTGPPPPPAIIYYLAEGATGPFFDTDLLLANPNAVPAPVTLTFLLEGGGTITQSRTLAPTSRTTIAVDEVSGLEAAAFSTMVTSTEGHAIAVERTMRWGSGGYGAHTEKATDAGGTTWYFAEGAAGYFSTYLLLGNPQPTANNAHVTWLREGEAPLTRSYPMAANSRVTVDTRADAELLDRSFGATVVFDQPGVAERSMYFGTDRGRRDRHVFHDVPAARESRRLAGASDADVLPGGRDAGDEHLHAGGGPAHDAQYRVGASVAGECGGRDACGIDRADRRRTRAVLGRAGVDRIAQQLRRHYSGPPLGARRGARWCRRRRRQRADVHPLVEPGHRRGGRDADVPAHRWHDDREDGGRAGGEPRHDRRDGTGWRGAGTRERVVRHVDRIDRADHRRAIAIQQRERRHVGRGHERHGDRVT